MTNQTKPKLVLGDGNAFAILGVAQRALRQAGRSDEWQAIHAEATAGDYNHLLRVIMSHFDVSLEGEDEEGESCGDCGADLTDTYDREWVDGDWYCLGCQPEDEDEDED